ncbi:MAG: lipocalin-like domain-containing protein [Desulfosalsimonadaceae bacterium]
MKQRFKWVLFSALIVAVSIVILNWRDASRYLTGGFFHPEAQVQGESIFLPVDDDITGYSRATEPGAIRFPADRGPHDEYQTEWWYYTGNLATTEGRRFGYQLTFFRRALSPPAAAANSTRPGHESAGPRLSRWRTNQVYLAHFAVSDIDSDRFEHFESFSRGAMGLAGAAAEPYNVWLENWHARSAGTGAVKLHAQREDTGIDLLLKETMPPILHGDRGLSPKGPEPGNASYYYSIIRQKTSGTVTAGGRKYEVTGLSWKDHEYSTSALSPGTVGWDWFSLQFDDGTALMFFQIRREDGTLENASSGTFIDVDGAARRLEKADWHVEVLEKWKSPGTGAVYPVKWRMEIGPIDLMISGGALMSDQEINVSTVYWEGAVAFSGTRAGNQVNAEGYVEMTGYAETMEGRF